jgi:hypothetical protein
MKRMSSLFTLAIFLSASVTFGADQEEKKGPPIPREAQMTFLHTAEALFAAAFTYTGIDGFREAVKLGEVPYFKRMPEGPLKVAELAKWRKATIPVAGAFTAIGILLGYDTVTTDRYAYVSNIKLKDLNKAAESTAPAAAAPAAKQGS